ncbi:hypothetical protein K493DRAFT_319138 [Basidiobolus meristosporus CBS 931.73]|uniref:Uncharacterized protein n=1 Tax=Basidiobolus meristosporus CBS 931.73 TaxID=1314790 RepID=A0A1Y1XTS8_9FUNG|nr:hypothetical protein K493DRAFT_319138 [Basidiobolus meristosporus CBS 931.73]|eukprot:ORX88906.1 hypothetical protein K493DRAFT_319138 [Basidiobolus meristosporus CBS 931.73]
MKTPSIALLFAALAISSISAKEDFPCPSTTIQSPAGEFFEIVQRRSYPKAMEACKACGGVLASIDQSDADHFPTKISGPVYVDIKDRDEYPYTCLAIFPDGKLDRPAGSCAGRIGALCRKL